MGFLSFLNPVLDIIGLGVDYEQNRQAQSQAMDVAQWSTDEQRRNNEIIRQNNLANQLFQQQFAKNAIRWRTVDAIRSGLHPLAALGANTVSYTPTHVGSLQSGGTRYNPPFSRMGQDFTRAVRATLNRYQKEGYDEQIKKENLKTLKLRNKLLEKEINKAGSPPAMPLVGKNDFFGSTGIIEEDIKPVRVVRSEVPTSSGVGVQAGIYPMDRFYVDKDNFVRHMYTQEASEPAESDWTVNVTRQIKEAGRRLDGILRYAVGSKEKIARLIPELRKLRSKLPKPKKGWELRYNLNEGAFRLVKDKYTKFFDHDDKRLNGYIN